MKHKRIIATLIATIMLFNISSCTTTKVPETTTSETTTTAATTTTEETTTEESRPILEGTASERIVKVLVDHNYKFMADINNTLTIEDDPASLENIHQGMYATAEDFEDPYCQIKGTYLYSIKLLEDDNLWNFVLACPKCNSSKSDKLADNRFLDLLIKRNDFILVENHSEMKTYSSERLVRIYEFALANGYDSWKKKL